MSKTLVIILNHNLPEFTDTLFTELSKYKSDAYDLEVMDNGSRSEFLSKHTSIRFEQNLFWGGALNKAFKMVLQNPVYDSLLFLNNDIEVNGKIFVQSLRHELFRKDFAIVSPCIAGKAAPWPQMQNWGSKGTRIVKWIDNQAPLFHRKLIEAIGQFDNQLYFGWGQELICHDVCLDHGWKIGVCDHVSIIHYKKQTFRKGRLFSLDGQETETIQNKKAVSHENYQARFRSSYFEYFRKNPLRYESFEQLFNYGKHYSSNHEENYKLNWWSKIFVSKNY
nr:hypothetical protein [Bacteroidota bacterium]